MSLYATMLANPDLRDEAQHSVAEHKEIEDYLTELYEMDFASTGWLTRFRTMRDRYLHHIDAEEEEMFPAAEKELSDESKKALIRIFEKEKPQEKAKAAAEEPSSEATRRRDERRVRKEGVSTRRRHTRWAVVTGVQTGALPI